MNITICRDAKEMGRRAAAEVAERIRLVDRVPIGEFHYIDGEADAESECRRVGELIAAAPIDAALSSPVKAPSGW